jgi:hypothetical protein
VRMPRLAGVLPIERHLVESSCAQVTRAVGFAPSKRKMIVSEGSRGERPPGLTVPELFKHSRGDPRRRKPDAGVQFRVPVGVCRFQLCLADCHG